MIFDLAKNLDFYRNLGVEGRYAKAVDFLKNTDLHSLAAGRYEIDGKNVYANVLEYTTSPWEEVKYEAHNNYTDIQYMIDGSEVMAYVPVNELEVAIPYNEEKDVTKYQDSARGFQFVVNIGQYMIFQPWDGHKPNVANETPAAVKKIVVKIKEN